MFATLRGQKDLGTKGLGDKRTWGQKDLGTKGLGDKRTLENFRCYRYIRSSSPRLLVSLSPRLPISLSPYLPIALFVSFFRFHITIYDESKILTGSN